MHIYLRIYDCSLPMGLNNNIMFLPYTQTHVTKICPVECGALNRDKTNNTHKQTQGLNSREALFVLLS